MFRKTPLIALTALLLFLPCRLMAQPVVFAPLPMENKETIIKEFSPLINFISETLGTEVVIDYNDSYAVILDKFRRNEIDIAYLGPLPYVDLKKVAPQAIPLVAFNEASGRPFYTCCLVAMGDSTPELNQLVGKKVALTQPLSTCGFLSVNGLLAEHDSKLSDNFYRYLDRHDEVALAVVRGEYVLGGLKTAIARKYAHLGLVIVDETDPLPSFVLVVNGDHFSAERIRILRDALVKLDPNGKDKDMLKKWGKNTRYGTAPIQDGEYDPVRKLLGDTVIPDKGNF